MLTKSFATLPLTTQQFLFLHSQTLFVHQSTYQFKLTHLLLWELVGKRCSYTRLYILPVEYDDIFIYVGVSLR